MKSIRKCAPWLMSLVILALLLSCGETPDPGSPTANLSSQALFSAWSLGAGRSEVLSWLAQANPEVEGWAAGRMLFASRPLDRIPDASLHWADTLVIRAVDLKEARLELVFRPDRQAGDRLAKIHLVFQGPPEDFQALKALAVARLAGWPNILKGLIWLSPDHRYTVFCGRSGHLWRYLAQRNTP